ncbi:hypothetical protein OEZ86_009726 [Tetradesmus obliquus]|uniref:Uncharacterized protein n=1 Tax=Tetradesmus obliquus TaxID=3088 RepID=A0ABY8UMZ5_TETOB|nr:hypothetical protein OEZ85_001169 [Tetradesmus obliquus]WIA43218.1 hypothetical protein OEZ86_009726 [Tetradesmus obliquus]
MMDAELDTGQNVGTSAPLEEAAPAQNVRMHKVLLYMRPKYAEDEYFGQLEALDLVNCIIAPVFFANALSMWTRGFLSSIYCLVLLLKGYQMGLLLLPNARRQHAHKRARYWLILTERVLRQCVATPVLGRGPRFLSWLAQQAADSSKPMLCMRLLMLLSGFTISFWNAFCLPLDFVSQAIITAVFFVIHYPPNCPQVAYAFQ